MTFFSHYFLPLLSYRLISIAHLIRKLAGDAFSIFNENGQKSKVGCHRWLKFIAQLALIISRTMVAGAVPDFPTCMHLFYFNFGKATNVGTILIELGPLPFFPATRPEYWPINFIYREKE